MPAVESEEEERDTIRKTRRQTHDGASEDTKTRSGSAKSAHNRRDPHLGRGLSQKIMMHLRGQN